jgi:hypothetical protein
MAVIDTNEPLEPPASLQDRLEAFARMLAAEQWYESSTYESSIDDKIGRAIAECKASIGETLLEVLRVNQ